MVSIEVERIKNMTKLISMKNICKSYDRDVLVDLNFEVNKGEFIVIVGKSGVGKTTLFNLVSRIEKTDHGYYMFDGENVDDSTNTALFRQRNIGFVFQNYLLLDKNSVIENITLSFQYKEYDYNENRVDEVILKLGIEKIKNQIVNTLSGGEKQRVAIARAIVSRPKILICDEPTGNLDESNALAVFKMLMNYNNEGNTVLVITHDHRILKYANKAYSLKNGKLYEI